MSSPEDLRFQQAARVNSRCSLIELRLVEIQASLKSTRPSPPLDLQTQPLRPGLLRVGSGFVFNVPYMLQAKGRNGEVAFTASLALSVVYNLDDEAGDSFTDEELESFLEVDVLSVLHPYLREIVHSLTGRMGLTPSLIELKRPATGEMWAT